MPHNAPRRQKPSLIFASVAVVGVVISLACGWMLATAFQSPAQVEALSAPPPASTITATVETGDLSRSLPVRARVEYGQQSLLILSKDPAAVVTRVIASLTEPVQAGDAVVELNGTPVFVLPGDFPFYRDLRPGDSGPDVSAFQRALSKSGFDIGVDGDFGARTEAGLQWLYERAGYEPPRTLGETVGGRAPSSSPQPPEIEAPESGSAPQTGAGTNADRESPSQAEPSEMRYLPQSAVAVTANLPATVTSVPKIGAAPEGGVTLGAASGDMRVVAAVTPETAAQLAVDTPGHVSSLELPVQVVSLGADVGEDGTVQVVLAGSSEALTSALGTEVVVDLRVSTATEVGLVVPTRSVIVRGDSTVVRKVAADGRIHEVDVTERASSLGRSVIEPRDPGALIEGDAVAVQ